MNAYTVTQPSDLIGVVPHLLGYTPQDSLVLVTGRNRPGRRGEIGLTVRFDFGFSQAAHLDPEDLALIVSTLEHAEDASCVFPLLFSDEVPTALGLAGEPESELLFDHFRLPALLICQALNEAGYEVADPLWAGLGHCGSLEDPAVTFDRSVSTEAEVAVRLIADGSSHAADFAAAASHPAADPDLLAEIARARRRALPNPQLFDAALGDMLGLHRLAVDLDRTIYDVADVLTPAGVLGIERMTEELWSRDCIEMVLGFDHPDFTPQRLGALQEGDFYHYAEPIARSVRAAELMIGLSPERPDFELTAYTVAYLGCLVPAVDDRHRAPVLAMLAWMEWARGRNSFADHYATQSLDLDPEYSLAHLISTAVTRGMPPRWMAR